LIPLLIKKIKNEKEKEIFCLHLLTEEEKEKIPMPDNNNQYHIDEVLENICTDLTFKMNRKDSNNRY